MSSGYFGLSLRRQLAIGLLVGLSVLGGTIAAGAYLFFERFQLHLTQQQLEDDSERLLTAIALRDSGPYLELVRLDPAYNRPLSGKYFTVQFGHQQWRSRSLWDSEMPTVAVGATRTFQQAPGPAGQQLLITERQYERFGETFRITVALDYLPLKQEFQRALWQFIAVWLLALTLTLLLLQLWLRRALMPLASARAQLQDIQTGKEMVLDENVPSELQPLIRQINALLGQTRESLRRSRNALGNFGHGLKTPLAVLSSLVEREEVQRHPRLQTQLRDQVHEIRSRVQRELAMARTAATSNVFEPFLPARDLPQLVAALEKAHGRILQVDYELAEDAVLPLDREDLLEVFGNALDNAWKWAASRVTIRVSKDTTHWLLSVEDDGPGIGDREDRQKALRRGYRLDESVSGQGLGLAIVADTVVAYGGKLSLARSALGGLALHIAIPRRNVL